MEFPLHYLEKVAKVQQKVRIVEKTCLAAKTKIRKKAKLKKNKKEDQNCIKKDIAIAWEESGEVQDSSLAERFSQ